MPIDGDATYYQIVGTASGALDKVVAHATRFDYLANEPDVPAGTDSGHADPETGDEAASSER